MKKHIILITVLLISSFLSCSDGLLGTYEDDEKTYNLRDIGPAGGYIFYINPNYKEDGWKYLEAAPSDWCGSQDPVFMWIVNSAEQIVTNGNTQTGTGTGLLNTESIITQNASFAGDYAAKICREYHGGGYSNWYLPSKDELDLMCWNLRGKKYMSSDNPEVPNAASGGLGGFTLSYYLSSSESSSDHIYTQDFIGGYQGTDYKSNPCRVRAIRAF